MARTHISRKTLERNIRRLSDQVFDVLIIGGGIYGATIARASALQGLKVALVERGDFGEGTSANSLKIIHGGLRYLQHLNLVRMRESIIARRRLLRLAPNLVSPSPFVIPTYGYGLRGRQLMASVLLINDLISWDRNISVRPERHIPRGRVLTRGECLKVIPGIENRGLTGGAQWYDCIVGDTERLTLSFILSSYEAGACVANYVRVNKYITNKNTVTGVEATDRLSGSTFDIQARLIINTAGAWGQRFLNSLPEGRKFEEKVFWAKAWNIFVNRPLFQNHAVGLAGSEKHVDKDAVLKKGNRYIFFVPWRDGTLIGTNYQPYFGKPEDCRPDAGSLVELVDEINRIYPAAELSFDDVSFAHAGLLPMETPVEGQGGNILLSNKEKIEDLEQKLGLHGVINVIGIKYTTAVMVADRVADLALAKLQRGHKEITDLPLCGGDMVVPGEAEPLEGASANEIVKLSIESHLLAHLKRKYGNLYMELLKYLKDDTSFGMTILDGVDTMVVEVVHAVRSEMARKLSDVVLRRTGLGSRGYPGRAVIHRCASIMAQELDWCESDVEQQISEVESFYTTFNSLGEAI